jgi:hypothetical protein
MIKCKILPQNAGTVPALMVLQAKVLEEFWHFGPTSQGARTVPALLYLHVKVPEQSCQLIDADFFPSLATKKKKVKGQQCQTTAPDPCVPYVSAKCEVYIYFCSFHDLEGLVDILNIEGCLSFQGKVFCSKNGTSRDAPCTSH